MIPSVVDLSLNILQVLEPSGGGSGRHFVDLCGELVRQGHKVTAIYSPRRAEPRFIEELSMLGLTAIVPVVMRRTPTPGDFAAWRAINAVMRQHGPFDIVHGHSSKAGALTRLSFRRRPRRVYTPHAFRTMDPNLRKSGRLIYRLIEGFLGRFMSDAIICVSEDERKHAMARLKIPGSRLTTVVNGAAPPPGGAREAIRARLGLRGSGFAFGFIGRLSPQKAPERIIAAFQRIAAERPDAELVMIGFGELEEDVKLQILEAHLSDRIHLTRDVTGAEAMQALDALVMPSRYEAMSYVMLEAAAAGLPMVLTDVGGASSVVDNGVNGLIVPNSDDIAELAEAMLTVSSPQRHPALKTAAAQRTDRFTLARMVDETVTVYRRVLGR